MGSWTHSAGRPPPPESSPRGMELPCVPTAARVLTAPSPHAAERGNSGVLPLGSGLSRCLIPTGGTPLSGEARTVTHSPTRGYDL